VGRNCTTSQREDYVKWDKKSGEREKIVDQLKKRISKAGAYLFD
jgi:hypothetical protein